MSQLDSYEVDEVFGCHLWTGKVSSTNARPIVWRGRTPVSAYKLAYEQRLGPVKAGLVLDHACRRNMCINPAHLEPVTARENELRKSFNYRCARKRCARGHSMSAALMTPEMGLLCRTCHVEAK